MVRQDRNGADFDGPVGYGAARESAKKMFQSRVWRLMLRKQWNQSDLARASGIGKDVISGYVRGKHLPDPPNAQRLAEALGVPPEELFPEIMGPPPVSNTPFDIRAIAGTGRAYMRITTTIELPMGEALALGAKLSEMEAAGGE